MKTALLSVVAALTAGAAELPQFRPVTVTSNLKMGYQLVVADLNRDGRKDLIVVDERAADLAWYGNPGWERHVLIEDVPRVINLECADVDNDGIPEIAMAHFFETNPERSIGRVLVLKSGADPRQKWTAREIDRVPTAHRLRWIQTEKRGAPLLLVAPLVGLKARAPQYAGTVPIYAYRPGEWRREVVSNELNGILHSIAPVEWNGRPQVLTASFDGLSVLEPVKTGMWKRRPIARGDTRACPLCGSSEVKLGHLGKRRFLAGIEPWHGNQVVVYLEEKGNWRRLVLDDTMVNGHALAVADLDGDRLDEIVAGSRGKGFRLTVFKADDPKGEKWTPHVIDETGIAAADCKIEDLNGDKRPDIACAGASTANIRIYENLSRTATSTR